MYNYQKLQTVIICCGFSYDGTELWAWSQKVLSSAFRYWKTLKYILRSVENVIIQLLKQFDILTVRKFFLIATQIPPAAREAHLKFDFRTDWETHWTPLFIDEGTGGKLTPRCLMVSAAPAMDTAGVGALWSAFLIHSQKDFYPPSWDDWGQLHRFPTRTVLKEPSPTALHSKTAEWGIMRALHDTMIVMTGKFLDYAPFKDKASFPNFWYIILKPQNLTLRGITGTV